MQKTKKMKLILLLLLFFFSYFSSLEICPIEKNPSFIDINHFRDRTNNKIQITIYLKGKTESGEIPLANQNITLTGSVFTYTFSQILKTDLDGVARYNISTCGSDSIIPRKCVDPSTLSYNITAIYEGTKGFYGSIKNVGYRPIATSIINPIACLPFLLILGLLMAAMYASGRDPFAYFDFSRFIFRPPRPERVAKGTTLAVYIPGAEKAKEKKKMEEEKKKLEKKIEKEEKKKEELEKKIEKIKKEVAEKKEEKIGFVKRVGLAVLSTVKKIARVKPEEEKKAEPVPVAEVKPKLPGWMKFAISAIKGEPIFIGKLSGEGKKNLRDFIMAYKSAFAYAGGRIHSISSQIFLRGPVPHLADKKEISELENANKSLESRKEKLEEELKKAEGKKAAEIQKLIKEINKEIEKNTKKIEDAKEFLGLANSIVLLRQILTEVKKETEKVKRNIEFLKYSIEFNRALNTSKSTISNFISASGKDLSRDMTCVLNYLEIYPDKATNKEIVDRINHVIKLYEKDYKSRVEKFAEVKEYKSKIDFHAFQIADKKESLEKTIDAINLSERLKINKDDVQSVFSELKEKGISLSMDLSNLGKMSDFIRQLETKLKNAKMELEKAEGPEKEKIETEKEKIEKSLVIARVIEHSLLANRAIVEGEKISREQSNKRLEELSEELQNVIKKYPELKKYEVLEDPKEVRKKIDELEEEVVKIRKKEELEKKQELLKIFEEAASCYDRIEKADKEMEKAKNEITKIVDEFDKKKDEYISFLKTFLKNDWDRLGKEIEDHARKFSDISEEIYGKYREYFVGKIDFKDVENAKKEVRDALDRALFDYGVACEIYSQVSKFSEWQMRAITIEENKLEIIKNESIIKENVKTANENLNRINEITKNNPELKDLTYEEVKKKHKELKEEVFNLKIEMRTPTLARPGLEEELKLKEKDLKTFEELLNCHEKIREASDKIKEANEKIEAAKKEISTQLINVEIERKSPIEIYSEYHQSVSKLINFMAKEKSNIEEIADFAFEFPHVGEAITGMTKPIIPDDVKKYIMDHPEVLEKLPEEKRELIEKILIQKPELVDKAYPPAYPEARA
jgi:Skp family chaperone for outer membrane proteins/ribosomal protein L29